MKQLIMDVLEDMVGGQVNLASEAARKMVATTITAALKTKGTYTEYGDDEIEEQNARATWVCTICGENTFEVDSDYIGSGTNHLGCEMKSWDEIKAFGGDTGTDADFNIPASEEVDGMYFDDEVKGWEEAVRVVDDAGVDIKTGKYVGDVQKQLYNEMTADGLPAGGDTQAVLESQKLAEEIVDNKDKEYIYESPDGGKTVYRRKFGEDERELVTNWKEVNKNEG